MAHWPGCASRSASPRPWASRAFQRRRAVPRGAGAAGVRRCRGGRDRGRRGCAVAAGGNRRLGDRPVHHAVSRGHGDRRGQRVGSRLHRRGGSGRRSESSRRPRLATGGTRQPATKQVVPASGSRAAASRSSCRRRRAGTAASQQQPRQHLRPRAACRRHLRSGAPDRAATGTGPPAGGQGSPPGTRGRPRRSCRAPRRLRSRPGPARTAPHPGRFRRRQQQRGGGGGGRGGERFHPEQTPTAGSAAPAVTMRAGASPAGGQGSPPSTRGRPRRIDRARSPSATSSGPRGR